MLKISYRRFYSHRQKRNGIVLEKKHSQSDTFYAPDPNVLSNAVGDAIAKELNLPEDYRDGVGFRTKMIKPTVTIKNYTHEVPEDRRRTCATCKYSSGYQDLHNGLYRVWCGWAEPDWKQQPHTLRDNNCRDWLAKNQDCIG